MATSPTSTPNDTAPSDLAMLLASWRRHLTAQRMSPATLATYSAAVRGLEAFLVEQAMPQAVGSIHREHVEAFITSLLERWKPATAHNRYRALRAFFGWLVEESEIPENPMARMKPPRLPEEPPPVLREADFRRILEVCERDKTFAGRRDDAVLRVLIDTGARRGEVLGLRLEDVDLDQGLLRVTGKGSRTRFVPVGDQTVRSLDRYLRARARHATATSPALWLSRRGMLRPDDPPSSPRLSSCLRPRHAGRRDAGDRLDGRGWLEEPRHGRPLRGIHAGRARDCGCAKAEPRRSPRGAH
jgi:site-specific recombinase XerD